MLAFDSIESEQGTPDEAVLVLHGILGSGQNWRSFARRLVERTPSTRYLLVDLRNHGDSNAPDADPTPGPHTLAACAADLVELAEASPLPVTGVIGHSFGGKVALAYAEAIGGGGDLRVVWSLDSPPNAFSAERAAEGDVAQVVANLRDIALPIASRDAVVDALLGAGHSRMLARWMTTNVRRDPASDGFVWRFDLDGVEAMLADFYRTDFEPFLTRLPEGLDVHLVRAGRSDRWSAELWSRLSAVDGGLTLHLLEDVGHWLHVEATDRLLALIAPTAG